MKLKYYVVRRSLIALVVLLGVTLITFMLSHIIPSNPASLWVGPHATVEQIEAARVQLGLNKPLPVQYVDYLWGILHGDLGVSIRTHNPVLSDIVRFLPASLEIIFVGMFIAVVVGIPLGVYSAANRNSVIDHLARLFSVSGVSMPTFWLAMILQLVFYQYLGLLPLGGRLSTRVALLNPVNRLTGFYLFDSLVQGNFVAFKDALSHIILPALAMAAYPLGLVTRMVRSSTIDVLGEDFISTERAFGFKERTILFVYALRNSFSSSLTVLALTFAYSLVSIVLIESIFSWPGFGRYAYKSIISVDTPAIMGITLLIAFIYVFLNLVVDILQSFLDPRVRAE